MHKKQEEILRTRIHNLEKVCLRQEKLLKRVRDYLCFFVEPNESFSLFCDIDKELKNDVC